jgi:GntR family transcriptional regulator
MELGTLKNINRPQKPLYQLVEDHISGLIKEGELVPGDLLPSEPELAQQLQVSQGTVKKALDNLVREKLLYRHQGKGTYVSRIDFNNSLFRFTTYGDSEGTATRLHKETIARHIEIGDAEACQKLNIEPGSEILCIERVGSVDEVPVMVEYSRWRADIVPGLEDEDVHIPDLLYALIEEKFRIPVVRAEETLTAGAATEKTAELLNMKAGDPVLVLNRATYTTQNRIIECRTSVGRADKFSYKTEIR